MTNQPPLLPDETFNRVCRVAKFDGTSVLVVAGSVALISATMGDVLGATVGVLAAGAGAMELHGVTLLHHGARRGMNWLLGSQGALLVILLGYCALQLIRAKLPVVPAEFDQALKLSAEQWDLSTHDFLLMFNRVLYGAVAIATLVYQGGMALYYLRRREAVIKAVETE